MLISVVSLLILCAALAAVIWISAYGYLKGSGEINGVEPIRSVDDLFAE